MSGRPQAPDSGLAAGRSPPRTGVGPGPSLLPYSTPRRRDRGRQELDEDRDGEAGGGGRRAGRPATSTNINQLEKQEGGQASKLPRGLVFRE